MRSTLLAGGCVLTLCGCGSSEAQPALTSADSSVSHDSAVDSGSSFDVHDAGQLPDSKTDGSLDASPDSASEASPEAAPEASHPDTGPVPTSCNLDYGFPKSPPPVPGPAPWFPVTTPTESNPAVAHIAHLDPEPPSTHLVPLPGPHPGPSNIVMPTYSDNMPLFERGAKWSAPTRCYETPLGVKTLTEAEAYDLYKNAAEMTTGVQMVTSDEVRTVVGIRGAYPGSFSWHGNTANVFNDTLVLLWQSGGTKNVREFPVNTDTGAHDFGVDSSSSLRANRRYHHVNGWHKTYNALHVDEDGYRVRDDTNNNGYWDSDRNGWLPPNTGADHDRAGGGHNIHMGSVSAPLGAALVDNWSAGCQVIPGIANWTEFITNAWTQEGDKVSYFLLDARDIAGEVWTPCTPDGTHACPYKIPSFPFTDSKDTTAVQTSKFDVYSCSAANESGSEVVYVLTVDKVGTLTASVDCTAPVDVDVHLLDADDKNACLARDDTSLSYNLAPGRYFIVVDTYVQSGAAQSGAFTLHVSWN